MGDARGGERETYDDLDDAAFAIIAADPEVEIVAHTERRIANGEIASGEEANPDSPLAVSHSLLHDVTVRTTRTRQCARVEGVPPEEFGIARNARSIRDADYCFHDVLRSEARLIAQGYDREQVRRLPSYGVADTIEAQARDTVEEGTQKQGDDGHNTASRLIRVTEHYVRMDYEGQTATAVRFIASPPAARARCSSATASPMSSRSTRSRSRR